ncbi:MAG: hypothetical protein ACREF7_04315 [Candidatus Saccharimonadales bacterium]
MIQIDEEQIEVEVLSHKLDMHGNVMFSVNIGLPDVGCYIKRATVQKSKVTGAKWWVQPPRYLAGKKWRSPVEFNTHLALWQSIEQAVIAAVENYLATTDTYIPTDEELNRPLTVDDFNLSEEGGGTTSI